MPRPTNDKEASVSTAHDRASVTWTMMMGAMFGSTCRNRIRGVVNPRTREARMKSASRSDSTGPRETRMKMGT